jgi:hypothetical protein
MFLIHSLHPAVPVRGWPGRQVFDQRQRAHPIARRSRRLRRILGPRYACWPRPVWSSSAPAVDTLDSCAHPANGARTPDQGDLVVGFDALSITLSCWVMAGLFPDSWAHKHQPRLESFLNRGTPQPTPPGACRRTRVHAEWAAATCRMRTSMTTRSGRERATASTTSPPSAHS